MADAGGNAGAEAAATESEPISEDDLRLVFARYATKGRRKDQIGKEEFAKMVLKLGVKLTAQQLRQGFEEIDDDGGGTLGFEEFELFLERGAAGGGEDDPFAGLADALRLEVQAARNAIAMAAKISQDDLKVVFKRYATVGPKKDEIDQDNFAKMVSKLGVKMTIPQLMKTFDGIDEDQGGSLGFDEFENWLAEGSMGDDEMFLGLADALVKEVQRSKNAMLLRAASNCDVDRVKHWIEQGAELDAKDTTPGKIGNTALFNAGVDIIKGAEVVKALLDAGADANDPNEKGQVPLYWACAQYKKRDKTDPHVMVTILASKGAKVDQAELLGVYPLMRAAQNGYLKTLQILVDHKADLHATDKRGRTALVYACLANEPECASFLAAAGSDINVKFGNYTPFTWCVKSGLPNVVQVLVDRGVDTTVTFKGKSWQAIASEQKDISEAKAAAETSKRGEDDGKYVDPDVSVYDAIIKMLGGVTYSGKQDDESKNEAEN